MDTLLEYLYIDAMKRIWSGSAGERKALAEWNAAQGKDWGDIYNAAQLLAERQSEITFFAGFHLGLTLENTLWQQLDVLF